MFRHVVGSSYSIIHSSVDVSVQVLVKQKYHLVIAPFFYSLLFLFYFLWRGAGQQYVDVKWTSWRHQSAAIRLFIQLPLSKKTSNSILLVLFYGWCRRHSHVKTSSWLHNWPIINLVEIIGYASPVSVLHHDVDGIVGDFHWWDYLYM